MVAFDVGSTPVSTLLSAREALPYSCLISVIHNALCGYPPKQRFKKFAKVKAQFLLNFDPNLKIPFLSGEKLLKN